MERLGTLLRYHVPSVRALPFLGGMMLNDFDDDWESEEARESAERSEQDRMDRAELVVALTNLVKAAGSEFGIQDDSYDNAVELLNKLKQR